MDAGIDFAKIVRATSRLARVLIVFLAALSGPKDVSDAFNAGADSYVTKPFKIDAHVQRIQSTRARAGDARMARSLLRFEP